MTRTRARALAAVAVLLLLGVPQAPATAAGAAPQSTWHAEQARVPDARAPGRGGEGVVVAVLDSWVDGAHRDFEGRVLPGADCTSGACREDGVAADACTHGTHVAGTVASSSYGVATRAQVLPVKVLAWDAVEEECSGTDTGVAAGIRWAVSRGARVLNLSLGTLVPGLSSSDAITAAVREATQAGAVVVFAAGNSSVPLADSYGGDALIVAATGPNGSLALYSQRGSGVSVAAPGGQPPPIGACSPEQCVTSLYPGDRYAVAAGTSMAAPHVAGIAALLLAQDPSRTGRQVVDRIRATTRPVPGGGAGDGLVDAAAALSGAPASRPPATRAPRTASPRPSSAAPAPASTSPAPSPAAVASGPTGAAEVPVLQEPEPLPSEELPPAVADPAAPTAASPAAEPRSALPPGPPALAAALLLAAGLSTALAGLRRSR